MNYFSTMTEKDTLWNRFIEEICDHDTETLSPIQKKAVLCFWYDAEMQNGGHSGYLENYPEINPDELADAIMTVGNKEMAITTAGRSPMAKRTIGMRQIMPITILSPR